MSSGSCQSAGMSARAACSRSRTAGGQAVAAPRGGEDAVDDDVLAGEPMVGKLACGAGDLGERDALGAGDQDQAGHRGSASAATAPA